LRAAEIGGARIWCSDRRGGASTGPYATCNVGDHVGDDPAAVAENRARIAAAAGLRPPSEWIWLHQVHGAVVHVADEPSEDVPNADAAVTSVPGLPFVVVTADCAPLVLACEDAIGVIHAGHRGLLAGVIERGAAQLGAMGLGPVRAFLGPCIRPDQYEFGADDLARLVDHFGGDVASSTSDGRPSFDIPSAVRIALMRAGVAPEDISDSGVCTASSTDNFSYRRDGTTGRQATIAVLM